MTTQNSSYSRILAVWMVLLAFLCGMILPSVAVAKLEMIIATDGDPGDGMDADGGGGGGGAGGNGIEGTPITDTNNINLYWESPAFSDPIMPNGSFPLLFIPFWVNGQFHFVIVQQIWGWEANR